MTQMFVLFVTIFKKHIYAIYLSGHRSLPKLVIVEWMLSIDFLAI